jgi:hypothetical protein
VNQIPGVSRDDDQFSPFLQKNVGCRNSALSLKPEAIRPSVAIEQGTITIASKRAEPLTNGTFISFSECAKHLRES